MKILKKSILALILCLSIATPAQFLPLLQPTVTVEAAAVKINKKSKTMYINSKFTLKITGTKQYVMWRSDNKKIASVSSKGVVTAKKEGVATITATVGSGSSGKQLKCKITVKPRLSVKKTTIHCYPNEYQKIKITANGLKANETVGIEKKTKDIVNISFKNKSNYWNVFVEPKKLGYTKFTARIYKTGGWSLEPQKDEIVFQVFSYPDKSGWIPENKLEAYGFTVLSWGDGMYELFDNNSSGFTADSISFDTLYDKQINANTYQCKGLRYQVKNGKFYLNAADMEKKFFK